MKQNTTVRSEIEEYIRQSGVDLQSFSNSIGLDPPMLSAMLHSNPLTMSIEQLDLITAGMGLSEGKLFELYIVECFETTNPDWERIRPFLNRCAELNRHDSIRKVLSGLVKDSNQTTEIFDAAEFLLERGLQEAAAIIYQSVIETEELNHSERLAISYYRLFQIYRQDGHKSFMIAMQFIPYRHRLPDAYALDGLLMLTQLFAVKQKWDEVENYSVELSQLAENIYLKQQQWEDPEFNPSRPLVYYYAQGYLFKAGSYEHRGMFEESKKWIAKYADMSWLERLDEIGISEVERFKMYAKANLLSIEIKEGDLTRVSEYLDFLKQYPDELVDGLTTLLDTSNRNNVFIDEYLDVFADKIAQYKINHKEGWNNQTVTYYYKEPFYSYRFHLFFRKYALYCFRKNLLREGLENVLKSFRLSFNINSKDGMVNSMALFEMHRPHATEAQQSVYSGICKEVWEYEENLRPFGDSIYDG
ncbi:DNA-binding protein [Paenibacillus antarcticus]|uniref:DNA-binding protein n=1 Tax=Paenibacillus antarcticus TaxID=253703 RepID=A0A162MGE5_9BACL|nr:DNA-binding protein [Paenibacillus antarcticus]OAB48405.1 DNA-binding protein [Paenibacillus antarcticus]